MIAVAAAWLTAAAIDLAAHRRDEYLQAARLAIDPDRVQVELDLTPGISVAEVVLAAIDVDGDGTVSAAEGTAYAHEVLRGISLDIDGAAMPVRLTDSAFPDEDAVRRGEGTIRLHLTAPAPRLAPGRHRLRYRNAHRSDIGVYLANALVPDDARVSVTDQQRDVAQRDLTIEYRLDPPARFRSIGVPLSAAVAALTGGLFISHRRRRAAAMHTRAGRDRASPLSRA